MRIASISEVIRGKLLNLPVVTTFNKVVFDARKVARGDLIFLSNIKDLDIALLNGAFVVVCEQMIINRGTEVAFIEVDDLYESIVRYLRFLVAYKDIDLFIKDRVTIELANAFIKDGRLLATTDPKHAITFLQNSVAKPVVILDPMLKKVHIKEVNLMPRELKVVSSTVCALTLGDCLMSIQVSPYFEESLDFIYALARGYNLDLRFHSREVALSRFNCVRFDDKLLIFDSSEDPQSVIDFLCMKAPWAKVVSFDGSDIDLIAKEIKSRHFQCAYLNNIAKGDLLQRLEDSGSSMDLFQ